MKSDVLEVLLMSTYNMILHGESLKEKEKETRWRGKKQSGVLFKKNRMKEISSFQKKKRMKKSAPFKKKQNERKEDEKKDFFIFSFFSLGFPFFFIPCFFPLLSAFLLFFSFLGLILKGILELLEQRKKNQTMKN